MLSILPVLSAVLTLISPVVYGRAILRGDVRPHRTTRLVLLIITLLAAASIFAQHNYIAIWLATASALQSIFIFALSLKYGMGGKSRTDILCLAMALTGILAWQITKQPVTALYCAILADFTGMIPAIIKTYRQPETEIWSFFAIDMIAGLLTVLATSPWSLQNVSYPLYILLINGLMVAIILHKRR